MPVGRIKCAYCDFIAYHPDDMEEHREDEHDNVIEAFKERERERSRIRRYKKINK